MSRQSCLRVAIACQVIAAGVMLASCDSPPAPTPIPTPTPTPTSTPARVPPQMVSGTVLGFRETGGWVPVPNLRLKVRAATNSGAVGSTPLADVVTDAQGRFTINDNSDFVLAFQTDPG